MLYLIPVCLSLMVDDQSVKVAVPLLLQRWVQKRACDSVLASEAGGNLALGVLETVSLS